MKTTRHSLMAKGILVLLSLLILIFVFTYSWYRDPTEPVTASGLVMSTRDATTDFQYAIGFANSQTGGAYRHTEFTNAINADLNLEELYAEGDPHDAGHKVNLLYDYNPTDLTGDGVTLVRPAMNYGNWSINTASRNYSVAEENVQYITFDMIFKTEVPNTTIRLNTDSYAKGACEAYSGHYTGNVTKDGEVKKGLKGDTASFNKENKYGAFSVDSIVGAVRVAFLGYTDNGESASDIVNYKQTDYLSTPLLLWVPRPDIYLNNNPTGSHNYDKEVTGWGLNTAVASNDTFNLDVDGTLRDKSNYSTYVHEYYNVFNFGQNQTPSIVTYSDAVASVYDANAADNKVTFGTQCDLITLDRINDTNNDNLPDDGFYYGKVRVRIWIEGTDSEARRALAGGKFNVYFHITG